MRLGSSSGAGVMFCNSPGIAVLDAWLWEQVSALVDGLCLVGDLAAEGVLPCGGGRVR